MDNGQQTQCPVDSDSNSEVKKKKFRKIFINASQRENKFESNEIKTGKYNVISFLPLFLYVEFRKAANIFFLFISILQQIPHVSPVGNMTTLLPLLAILFLAAIKEIIEDYKRQRSDKRINNNFILVLKNQEWAKVTWQQVHVGDIVKVLDGQGFPSDMIMLASSEPLSMCYIETSNLDGETNLKIRKGLEGTAWMKEIPINYVGFKGILRCELPNKNVYNFNGNMEINQSRPLSLSCAQLLQRGATLRNTHWVTGIVVYAGHKTKLMMNANRAPLKMSNMDRTTNIQIWFLFIILLVISLMSAFGSNRRQSSNASHWYIPDDNFFTSNYMMEVLTFVIVYNNLVPISLLVTLEIVKFMQAVFISNDIEMYDAESDTPAMARTSNLNEELGQIKYIFSDKTGTLTQNKMLLKRCSIAGHIYSSTNESIYYNENMLQDFNKNTEISDFVYLFLLTTSVCHTVVPERDGNSDTIRYISSSPDETALIKGAQSLGFIFKSRLTNSIIIEEMGKNTVYKILQVLEFSSTRKRMSVIVQLENGQIILFCKGADNVIYERLHGSSMFKHSTERQIEQFAKEGLRTMCFAYKYIDEDFYELWNEKFAFANANISDRKTALESVYEIMEQNLFLIGASAIEDKLQDGVPETIEKLSKADIKLWVLTGDKRETALNIGYSSRLLNKDMNIVTFCHESFEDTKDFLQIQHSENGLSSDSQHNLAVVVTGQALEFLLQKNLKLDFFKIALCAKVVICCRVSPLQKAEIVNLVKGNCKAITLAIGDGANDVSMIQAAHVGVGISGQEGLQAANSSDYSIAQFRFLQKLLLVHGVWNHDRVAKCILYCFYKNICLYLIQLWFALFNGFSGQVLFEKWTISLYNFITAFPPLALGLFEQMFASETMLKYPSLYSISQSAVKFNTKVFWKMILNSIYHSALLFFIPALITSHDITFSNGQTGGYLFLGNFVYTYVVATVCFKAGLESSFWTIISHLAIWGSIIAWFLVLIVYSYFWPVIPMASEMYGQGSLVLSCPLFWFGFVLVPVAVLMKDVIFEMLRRTFDKTIVEEVQDLELSHKSIPENTIEVAKNKFFKSVKLLTKVFQMPVRDQTQSRSRHSALSETDPTYQHGFAFSQDETGVVSQTELINAYGHKDDQK